MGLLNLGGSKRATEHVEKLLENFYRRIIIRKTDISSFPCFPSVTMFTICKMVVILSKTGRVMVTVI